LFRCIKHIEPEKLDLVLEHISNKTNKVMYFSVCNIASYGTFPNGQNLHLIIEDKDWWIEKLSKYFTFKDLESTTSHIWGLAIKK